MSDTRAAFLDRDGTIIVDKEYLSDPNEIVLIEGAVEGMKLLLEAGYKLVIVTNQSGIARGLYSIDDYRAVATRLNQRLAASGVPISGAYFCPHHPDFSGPCECRKPGLGLYREAARNLGIDLASSLYVGDRLRDVEPALALGGRGILIDPLMTARPPAGIDLAADLPGAARLITKKTAP